MLIWRSKGRESEENALVAILIEEFATIYLGLRMGVGSWSSWLAFRRLCEDQEVVLKVGHGGE